MKKHVLSYIFLALFLLSAETQSIHWAFTNYLNANYRDSEGMYKMLSAGRGDRVDQLNETVKMMISVGTIPAIHHKYGL